MVAVREVVDRKRPEGFLRNVRQLVKLALNVNAPVEQTEHSQRR